jgi:hypothetical protein
MISKTIVLDRTPPQVDPNIDIKVDGRVKADAPTQITAIIRDGVVPGINAVEAMAVVFQTSRRGNTQEATSTWRFAEAPPELTQAALGITPIVGSSSSASSSQISQFGLDSDLLEMLDDLGIETLGDLTDWIEPDELQDMIEDLADEFGLQNQLDAVLDNYNVDTVVELIEENPDLVVEDLLADIQLSGGQLDEMTVELATQLAFAWVTAIALDTFPDDGWTAMWQTPRTDQNVRMHVRAVPFDDALNVYVGQTNQVEVIVDGSVPKAKVVEASVSRAGATFTDGADGFELYPDDTDVLLTAEMVENIDGDLDGDGIIEPDAGEGANLGTKGISFEYSLNELSVPGNWDSDIVWYPIRATQYSDAVRVPTAEGKWQATWQVDFSKLVNEERDQYLHVRALAEDEVGNKDGIDDKDPILSIMVLNDITGPQAYMCCGRGR